MHDPLAQRVDERLSRLESACRAAGIFVTGDGRVVEQHAAELVGLDPKTLANRRSDGRGPRWLRLSGNGHRITYDLRDLAEWIEALRCE